MPLWLLILILIATVSLFWIAILGAVIFTASARINRANVERDAALKQNFHSKQLLDAYGVKEITIKEDD